MESDDDLRTALEGGCTFALVRVLGVEREKAGTRSQTAAYPCKVVRAIENPLPSPVVLKHFGLPRLDVGRAYVVGAIDSGRHHGAWEMRFADAADTAHEEPDQAVASFLSRRAAVAARPAGTLPTP